MIELTNYHKQSMKIENKYADELLIPFSTLLLRLNSIPELTVPNIEENVKIWKIENGYSINEINAEFVNKAESLANELIPAPSIFINEKKAIELTRANDQMLNVTTEYIKQKYIELSILEKNYSYTDKLSNEFIAQIVNSTQDKIVLFSTMSTIQSVREFLFINAVGHSYTEYMWETQRDYRVRYKHAIMDKKWVRIDTPPKKTGGYHVGQDYNCRCYARFFR